MTEPVPEIPVEVAVDEELLPPEGVEATEAAVARAVDDVAARLHVPGRARVIVSLRPAESVVAQSRLRLRVHGRRRPYAYELIARVMAFFNGRMLRPAQESEDGYWGPELAAAAESGRFEQFVALVCREAINARPAVLLAPAQAQRYIAGTPAVALDPDWVCAALSPVLDARIGLGERDTIARILLEREGSMPADAAEALITALRPDVLIIAMRREYLHALVAAHDEDQGAPFARMRALIADALGLELPRLEFEHDDGLAPRHFAFRINGLMTLPWLGLAPDQCLVDEDPGTLELLDIPAGAGANPVSGRLHSVIAAELRGQATAFHLETWNALEHVALCLEATVRWHASSLVDEEFVRRCLRELPLASGFGETARSRASVARVTRVLRALLAEGVGITNFPGILETIVESEPDLLQTRANASSSLWSDRAPQYQAAIDEHVLTAVRSRLKRQIMSTAVVNGLSTHVNAMVLDEPLHDLLALHEREGHPLEPADADALARAVRARVGNLASSQWPVLLTTLQLRASLRAVLAPEFPRLHVIAYEELPGDVTFTIVDRVVRLEADPAVT